jgi:hypothetical protein
VLLRPSWKIGRPAGSAGHGGDVATRPDSRDAPHLFGLGLQEMIGDEITAELRAIRDEAIEEAQATNSVVERELVGKSTEYGTIKAYPDGTVDTSEVEGVNADLRVRPFFAQGGTSPKGPDVSIHADIPAPPATRE